MLPDNCQSFWIIVIILTSTTLSVANQRKRVFKFVKVTTIEVFSNRHNVGQPISTNSSSLLYCATHLMQYGPFNCMKYYALQGICRSNNGGETVNSIKSNINAGWTLFNVESVGNSIEECKMTELGREYRGNANVTLSGIRCQSWGDNWPHIVDGNVYNTLGLEEDHAIYTTNHCRNPDGYLGPWCYTMNPNLRYELCDVPKCQCYN